MDMVGKIFICQNMVIIPLFWHLKVLFLWFFVILDYVEFSYGLLWD